MRTKLTIIIIFGILMVLVGIFSGTNIKEGETTTTQIKALQASIINYSGIIVVIIGTVGMILSENK